MSTAEVVLEPVIDLAQEVGRYVQIQVLNNPNKDVLVGRLHDVGEAHGGRLYALDSTPGIKWQADGQCVWVGADDVHPYKVCLRVTWIQPTGLAYYTGGLTVRNVAFESLAEHDLRFVVEQGSDRRYPVLMWAAQAKLFAGTQWAMSNTMHLPWWAAIRLMGAVDQLFEPTAEGLCYIRFHYQETD